MTIIALIKIINKMKENQEVGIIKKVTTDTRIVCVTSVKAIIKGADENRKRSEQIIDSTDKIKVISKSSL